MAFSELKCEQLTVLAMMVVLYTLPVGDSVYVCLANNDAEVVSRSVRLVVVCRRSRLAHLTTGFAACGAKR